MYASTPSFGFDMRCDDIDMVGIGFWNSRVLKGKMKEIGGRKLRGLMVYEKAIQFSKIFYS